MQRIYEILTGIGKLDEKHRVQMKEMRGFSDETIDGCRFFSGGAYLAGVEGKLIKDFKEEDLLESGVFIKPKGSLTMSPILFEDRVIIPYLNKDNVAYFVRPHKLGLKDVQLEVYQERNFSRTVVLTEGEFKAAAAMQMGVPCVAVPGVGSFSNKHFARMVAQFNSFGVKDVIVMFDNEVKDDPAYPQKYKENPANRWDVQYYAHMMASMLVKEGFLASIATLPDGWRVDGKADIDGALAQGRTGDDLRVVMASALTHKEYLAELPEDAKKVVARKWAKRKFRGTIKKEWGKYHALRAFGSGKHRTEEYVEVSNFTLKIIATHETPEGVVREVVMINEFGDRSGSFPLSAVDMMSNDKFRAFCSGKGNFLWRGKQDELDTIWQEEFLDDDGRHIVELDHVGYIDREKIFLAGNVMFAEGKEIRPDKTGIFWTEKRGVKPMAINVAGGKGSENIGVPLFNFTEFDQREILDHLILAIGETDAKICMGWCGAVMYMKTMFDLAGCFPMLFLSGKRSSGKSHVAKWLMHLFGVETEGIQAHDTTSVGLQRYLGYYSYLPVYMDEYRNIDKVTNKNGLLRNVYNRQAAVKGIRADHGVRVAEVRGTMLLAGQEMPRDNAIMSRSVLVVVSEQKRDRDRNPFNWFVQHKGGFSNVFLRQLRDYKEGTQRFVSKYEEARAYFSGKIPDDRKATNYAAVAAGYWVLFGDDNDFARALTRELVRVHEEIDAEEESVQFWEDLLAMRQAGKIRGKYWVVKTDPYAYSGKDGSAQVAPRAYVYFNGLYNLWAEDYAKRNRETGFTAASLRSVIKNEPYCVNEVDKYGKPPRVRINQIIQRCMVFDLETAPEALRDLVSDEDEAVPPENG